MDTNMVKNSNLQWSVPQKQQQQNSKIQIFLKEAPLTKEQNKQKNKQIQLQQQHKILAQNIQNDKNQEILNNNIIESLKKLSLLSNSNNNKKVKKKQVYDQEIKNKQDYKDVLKNISKSCLSPQKKPQQNQQVDLAVYGNSQNQKQYQFQQSKTYVVSPLRNLELGSFVQEQSPLKLEQEQQQQQQGRRIVFSAKKQWQKNNQKASESLTVNPLATTSPNRIRKSKQRKTGSVMSHQTSSRNSFHRINQQNNRTSLSKSNNNNNNNNNNNFFSYSDYEEQLRSEQREQAHSISSWKGGLEDSIQQMQPNFRSKVPSCPKHVSNTNCSKINNQAQQVSLENENPQQNNFNNKSLNSLLSESLDKFYVHKEAMVFHPDLPTPKNIYNHENRAKKNSSSVNSNNTKKTGVPNSFMKQQQNRKQKQINHDKASRNNFDNNRNCSNLQLYDPFPEQNGFLQDTRCISNQSKTKQSLQKVIKKKDFYAAIKKREEVKMQVKNENSLLDQKSVHNQRQHIQNLSFEGDQALRQTESKKSGNNMPQQFHSQSTAKKRKNSLNLKESDIVLTEPNIKNANEFFAKQSSIYFNHLINLHEQKYQVLQQQQKQKKDLRSISNMSFLQQQKKQREIIQNLHSFEQEQQKIENPEDKTELQNNPSFEDEIQMQEQSKSEIQFYNLDASSPEQYSPIPYLLRSKLKAHKTQPSPQNSQSQHQRRNSQKFDEKQDQFDKRIKTQESFRSPKNYHSQKSQEQQQFEEQENNLAPRRVKTSYSYQNSNNNNKHLNNSSLFTSTWYPSTANTGSETKYIRHLPFKAVQQKILQIKRHQQSSQGERNQVVNDKQQPFPVNNNTNMDPLVVYSFPTTQFRPATQAKSKRQDIKSQQSKLRSTSYNQRPRWN